MRIHVGLPVANRQGESRRLRLEVPRLAMILRLGEDSLGVVAGDHDAVLLVEVAQVFETVHLRRVRLVHRFTDGRLVDVSYTLVHEDGVTADALLPLHS